MVCYILSLSFILLLSGCARFADNALEPARVVWGSSTRTLDKARVTALSKTYYCSFEDCYNATLLLGREWDAAIEAKRKKVEEENRDQGTLLTGEQKPDLDTLRPESETIIVSPEEEAAEALYKTRKFTIFIKNAQKKHLVIFNLPGSVDTTEVGVFFVPLENGRVKIDISSLSTNAKRTAAEIIFPELSQHFKEAIR